MAGANRSVARVKAMLKAIPKQLAADLPSDVFAEAHALADAQRVLVAKGETLQLLNSIRVEEGSNPLQAIIKAGGRATTKRVRAARGIRSKALSLIGAGVPTYDYARGNEFGTVDQPAQPFFYPPYRKGKTAIRRRMRRKAKASMKKVAPIE